MLRLQASWWHPAFQWGCWEFEFRHSGLQSENCYPWATLPALHLVTPFCYTETICCIVVQLCSNILICRWKRQIELFWHLSVVVASHAHTNLHTGSQLLFSVFMEWDSLEGRSTYIVAKSERPPRTPLINGCTVHTRLSCNSSAQVGSYRPN